MTEIENQINENWKRWDRINRRMALEEEEKYFSEQDMEEMR
jgi:hypothetical protein